MANNLKLSNGAANGSADGLTALCDSGYVRIYDGTQPATADTALSGQTLLAELRFGAPAFASAVNGVATANSITADTSANATSVATWFRVLKSDGTSVLFDGTVGLAGSDMNINSTSIVVGAEVSVSAFTYTQNKG